MISCAGSDIPIQSTAVWSVHSTLGVHCSSKGGETDGHTQGYKNPLVPRRLVGERYIPPGLSPAYSRSSEDIPRTWLAGELRKISPTHTGLLAEPSGQNTRNTVTNDLSGPAVHVPDRFTNGHRKASSPRPTTHETHTVASQKQLESTRATRKSDSNSQVPAPPLTMVATGRQRSHRPTIAPIKHALQIFTDASKEGWGAHLNKHTARGSWSLPESKLHINYLELKAVFLALKEFQDLCTDKIVLVATDNTTVVSSINKEGGMRSGPLCALLGES